MQTWRGKYCYPILFTHFIVCISQHLAVTVIVFSADKMSFDGRAQFADENMESIRAAVHDPFGTNDWWTKFDDPFQGLATCHEIVQAIDSGDHENYLCCLPVHMDGSCNGLQHYAALGRDRGGGKAVNLCVADKPQDVYIGVMHEVVKRVAQDAEEMIPFDENKSDLTRAEKDFLKKTKSAQLVNGLIDRGVVKRTVMTSVYGVTYIGAKNQISEKIEEKLEGKGYDIDEIEPQIHMACGYLASLTMEVMGQQFKGARETMNWLTKCARLIAAQGQPVSFISPIGVPVVQPCEYMCTMFCCSWISAGMSNVSSFNVDILLFTDHTFYLFTKNYTTLLRHINSHRPTKPSIYGCNPTSKYNIDK